MTSRATDLDEDAVEQLAILHYKTVHAIFSNNATRMTKEHLAKELHVLIGRGIPMLTGDAEDDITKPTLRAFLTQDWPEDGADLISKLFKAYVAAGYIEVQDSGYPVSFSAPSNRPVDGSLLELAVRQGSHHAVRTLLELGADISCVPFGRCVFRTSQGPKESSGLTIERGDVLGLAIALGRQDDPLFMHLTAAVMQRAISASHPAPANDGSSVVTGSEVHTTDVRMRRARL